MGDRMALGITTILTIMFLLGSLNGTMPRVSYPKALDWYLLVSFTFVFLSLIECMIVFVLTLKSNKGKESIKDQVRFLKTIFFLPTVNVDRENLNNCNDRAIDPISWLVGWLVSWLVG